MVYIMQFVQYDREGYAATHQIIYIIFRKSFYSRIISDTHYDENKENNGLVLKNAELFTLASH